MKGHLFLILSLSFLLFFPVSAQQTFVLTDTLKQSAVYGPYLAIYEDKTGDWDIGKATSFDNWKSFVADPSDNHRISNKSWVYWLHFRILDGSSDKKDWVLEFFDHNIHDLTLYEKSRNEGIKKRLSGDNYPFNIRKIRHKNHVFELNVTEKKVKEYYIRIKSHNKSIIKPEVRASGEFISYALNEYYFLGLFYGILGIMALYNLLLFALIRRRYYLYYSCYIFSVFVYTMCRNGLAFALLWPSKPVFNNYAEQILFFLSIAFLIFLVRDYLNLSKKARFWDKVILILLGVRLLMLFILSVFVTVPLNTPYADLILLILTCPAVWSALSKSEPGLRYFIAPYTLILLTLIIHILEQYDLVASGILTVYSFNIGMTAEIILLSFSLAFAHRHEVKERERLQKELFAEMTEKELLSQKVNRELEEKVKQRTLELNIVNEKLNDQIAATNKANAKLDLLNFELKQHVSEISLVRIEKPVADPEEFEKVYSNDHDCYRYLASVKQEKGFECPKCGSSSCGKGKELFDRRCTRCGYNESVTANTLFHKLKFPIHKAFYITHLVFTRKDITGEELSAISGIRKETCFLMKKKISERQKTLTRKELENWKHLLFQHPGKESDYNEH